MFGKIEATDYCVKSMEVMEVYVAANWPVDVWAYTA